MYFRKILIHVFLVFICISSCLQVYGEEDKSNIVARGSEVPIATQIPEDKRISEKYQENAIQFISDDGVN